MKKYVKPMIVLERYELNQNIAACAWDLNHADTNSCYADPDQDFFYGAVNRKLFLQSSSGCEMIAGVEYEDYCYQNGSNSPFNVFRS